MAGGTVAHSSWSSAGKYCHGFYGSVRNFHDNPNNVMCDEVSDMLKMSYDLIPHHLQRPYGIQALTGQGMVVSMTALKQDQLLTHWSYISQLFFNRSLQAHLYYKSVLPVSLLVRDR